MKVLKAMFTEYIENVMFLFLFTELQEKHLTHQKLPKKLGR